jgi:hypothetical protein
MENAGPESNRVRKRRRTRLVKPVEFVLWRIANAKFATAGLPSPASETHALPSLSEGSGSLPTLKAINA